MVTLLLAACGEDGNGPEMMPGEACMSCHKTGSGDPAESRPFSFAGTVYLGEDGAGASGVMVTVVDARQEEVTTTSNGVGNFFSETPLVPPFMVTVARGTNSLSMAPAVTGDCNRCHSPAGEVGKRLIAP
jgi:hypothetical protein